MVKRIAFKLARADTQESHPVAVTGIDIGMYFKYKPSEFIFFGFHLASVGHTWFRRRRYLYKGIEQILDTEVIDRTTEKHRCQLAGQIRLLIKTFIDAHDEFHIFTKRIGILLTHKFLNKRSRQVGYFYHILIGGFLMRTKGEETVIVHIIHAFEIAPHIDRPRQRLGFNPEFLFNFFEQVKGIAAIAIHLINKDNHGCIAHTADFHQFFGLFLHAFHTINHEHHTIYGGKGTIGIFGKIFMPGRIEEVNEFILVFEAHHRGRHRDTSLTFDFHKVGGSVFLNLV